MLQKKTVIITGASRGIGLAIATRLSQSGANIVILSKDSKEALEHAAKVVSHEGAECLILDIDVSDVKALKRAVIESKERFGGIDALINNTSATCFTDTKATTPEQFDLVMSTSARAAFFLTQACLPYLEQSSNPHVINISPPLHMEGKWFKDHLAFSLGKYAMSLNTLGMSEEFKKLGIAVNSLWPETTIATQTIKDHFSDEVYKASRYPTIMADAAHALLLFNSRECTGRFFTDEKLLRETGMNDFSKYAVTPGSKLMQALFVSSENKLQPISKAMFLKQ